jgi:predicted lipoprotein with Yx(FWY)xxD motif/plastocyanin
MNTMSSVAKMRFGVTLFGLVVLALVVAACAAPVTSAPPAQVPAATQAAVATQAPASTVAPADTTAPAQTGASAPAVVMVANNDQLGSFLVDDQGRSLYLFTKDTPNTSNCYDKCEQAWPPLFTQGAPTAGTGADASLLGTTTRKDGKVQVTYNGWPLYYFVKDQKAGDVTGQDVGGVWYVLSAKGEKVESASGSSPAATATSTTGSSGSAAQTVTISVKNFAFDPKELTVSAGTTVVWHNEDSVGHTVTSDTGLFDNPLPSGGADFQFTFSQPGTYAYYCRPHGGPGGKGMSGVITVK